ncbi:uncharacterized protein F4812DRAFT_436152 [Daldinia caldariorum]|uniref:uncharacterized protein n=1 Tax=Daldinia caldariorum TaxID=326644 RepID=UPI002007AB64|nr:uncharacterized protein F4812DRAFT_436152 [Daldinia caldariorum]KAI1466162.1 hypothetical protein F4812DRAFT_436152 [Daldinia caldariorum]
MGLPLWVEPDESGSSDKKPAKSSTDPATARSPIRRSTSPRRTASSRSFDRRLQHIRNARAQRLNTVVSQQANNSEEGLDLTGPASMPDYVSPLYSVIPGYSAAAELETAGIPVSLPSSHRATVPSNPPGVEISSDDELPAFGDAVLRNSTRLRSSALFRPLRSNEGNNGISAVNLDTYLHAHSSTMEDSYRTRSRRTPFNVTLDRYVDRFRLLREEIRDLEPNLTRVALPSVSAGSSTEERLATAMQDAREMRERRRRVGSIGRRERAHRVRYVDGLGDRDRSLSPEGDGVWSILQSTLTMDPQPPSVGSSFASTTASTIASLTPTVPSSRTSTSPNEEVEPPCDPVDEPEGTAEDSGADAEGADRSRRPTPHGRRSYAAVAADRLPSGEISPDDPEWLSGMHRIVSGLASRQDIPDEWWEQAGLSRSMSWGWPS